MNKDAAKRADMLFGSYCFLFTLFITGVFCSQSYAYRTSYAPRPGRLVVIGYDTGGTPPAGDDFVAIACGANHNIAMRADVRIYNYPLNSGEIAQTFAGASPYDFGICTGGIPQKDFTGDCRVGHEDLQKVIDNWLTAREGW